MFVFPTSFFGGGTANTITVGSANNFSSTVDPGAGYVLLQLTGSTSLLTAKDSQSSGNGIAFVLSVSGTTITGGSQITFQNSGGSNVSNQTGGLISSTRAFITFGHSGTLKGVVLDISGTTVTANTVTDSGNSPPTGTGGNTLVQSATESVLYYRSSSTYTVRPVALSGTSITFSSITDNGSTSKGFGNSCLLTTGKALISYLDNSNNAILRVADFTGSSVSFGSEVTVASSVVTGNSLAVSVTKITSSSALVVWGSGTNLNAMVVTISGNTITTNATFSLDASATATDIVVTQMDTSTYLVVYQGISSQTTAVIAIVTGTSVARSGSVVTVDTATAPIGGGLVKMSTSTAMLIYQITSAGSTARARILTLS